MKRLLPFVFLLIALQGNAQNTTDSLWTNWKTTSLADTVRLYSLNDLILDYYLGYKNDSAIILAQLQFDLASRVGNKKQKARALLNQGKAYYNKGENLKAVELETRSLIISEGIKDKRSMGNTLCNLGNVFLEMGNYSDAVDKYTKSMRIAEEIGNKNLVAANLANIGIICFSQGDYKKAMEYNTKNLKIVEQLGDIYALGYSYRNIGKVHQANKEYQKALFAYTKSYNYSEKADDPSGMSYSLNYLGTTYHSMKDYDKAQEYYSRSLAMAQKLNDTYGIAENFDHIGTCYLARKEYAKAIEYCKKSLAISEKTQLVLLQRNATKSLHAIYKATGDYKQALEMHEAFSNIKDTILSEENRKGVLKKEIQYKYEKQSLADSLSYIQKQQLNELEHTAQLDKEKNQRYFLYGGLIFAVIIGSIALRGYQRKKRDNAIITSQKKEVELQKDIVEEKQKEIIDSISYAKRIQDAILPPERLVKQWLPDSFVFYKPKDIVAGDFYWMEILDGRILLTAADCTGHGVPGALVSVVCSNALNRSVKEFGFRKPGEILDKTRELVMEAFDKSEEEVKDGMDISLLSISYKSNSIEAEWAGANNPLWITRNEELIEYKPDKQPIGQYIGAHSFRTQVVELQKGDCVYLFTDGFQDQFGEASGKKFKSAQMRKMLLSIQDKTMDEQKIFIESRFTEWKGTFEQVDDVCIIGIRV
ncbi:MAG TPA: tetratricopeptide repeat protein [Bacteroidia bacterium]